MISRVWGPPPNFFTNHCQALYNNLGWMAFKQLNFCALFPYSLAPQGIFYIYVLQITEHMFQLPTLSFPPMYPQSTASILSMVSCLELWKCPFTEELTGNHRQGYQNWVFNPKASQVRREGRETVSSWFQLTFLDGHQTNIVNRWVRVGTSSTHV